MTPELKRALEQDVSIEIDESLLPLVDTEIQRMEKIAELFSKVDTESISPMVRCFEVISPLREDQGLDSLSRKEALKNVRFQEDGWIQMPRAVK